MADVQHAQTAPGKVASRLRLLLGVIADHPVGRVAELLPWAVPDLAARLDQRGSS